MSFSGELVGPVVVRAARDDRVHAVRVVERHDESDRARGHAGGVGAARRGRPRLFEGARGAEAAVDLVRRDLDEAAHAPAVRAASSSRSVPRTFVSRNGSAERMLRSTAALGREVHDGLDLVAAHGARASSRPSRGCRRARARGADRPRSASRFSKVLPAIVRTSTLTRKSSERVRRTRRVARADESAPPVMSRFTAGQFRVLSCKVSWTFRRRSS